MDAMQLYCLDQVNSSALPVLYATAPVQPVECDICLSPQTYLQGFSVTVDIYASKFCCLIRAIASCSGHPRLVIMVDVKGKEKREDAEFPVWIDF